MTDATLDAWLCEHCQSYNLIETGDCTHCPSPKPLAVTIHQISVNSPAAMELMGQQSQTSPKPLKSPSKGKKEASKRQPEELELEERFNDYWLASNTGYALVRQHRGIVKYIGKKGKPVYTNHKFDFALPSHNLAIEIQGGIFNRGRHVRPIGYTEDRAKIRKATLQGWEVWEYTTIDMNKNNLHNVVTEILAKIAQIEALERKAAA